mgnify:CR=1 FL=1
MLFSDGTVSICLKIKIMSIQILKLLRIRLHGSLLKKRLKNMSISTTVTVKKVEDVVGYSDYKFLKLDESIIKYRYYL